MSTQSPVDTIALANGAATDARILECMEIWAGNRAVHSAARVPGIDIWVYARPYGDEAEGGDIHYVSLCGGGKISRFAIADITGHGASAGRLATALRGLMRKYIGTVSQTDFVRRLNKEFVSFAQQGRFATALVATYFAPTDNLILCNAGHPRPLWYRAASKRWQFLDAGDPSTLDRIANIPLGIISPTDYDQFAVSLEPDDLVLLYTDSLPEWTDTLDRHLTEAGLLTTVEGLDAGRPESLVPTLLETIARERGTDRAADDMTLIVLRHNATNPAPLSLGQIFRSIVRMLHLVKV